MAKRYRAFGNSFVLAALLIAVSATGAISAEEIRKPVVAGAFYPADAKELAREVDGFIKDAPKKELNGEVVALLAPHAGYEYSGKIAGYAYKAVEGLKFDTIIVVGLSHRVLVDGAAIYPSGKFETPLGLVDIDKNLADELMLETDRIKIMPQAHQFEHSVEVQIPFFQRAFKDFKIVPMVMNEPSFENIEKISDAISGAVKRSNKKILLIASSDMSHYPNYLDANYVDKKSLEAIERFDVTAFLSYEAKAMQEGVSSLECVLCGDAALSVVMASAKKLGADKAVVLGYANSGDATGDKSRVVGYGAVAFIKSSDAKKEDPAMFDPSTLDEGSKKELLAMAREAIRGQLDTGSLSKKPAADKFKLNGAVFVTLTEGGELRGCIGQTQAVLPLGDAVRQMAVEAAFGDPRFRQISKDEFDKIKIEISILSPLKRVKDASEITLRTHGVVVKRGFNSGIFLPQVAEETGWSKEEFLNTLCAQKAGLPKDAWKDPKTELYVFTVEKFHE